MALFGLHSFGLKISLSFLLEHVYNKLFELGKVSLSLLGSIQAGFLKNNQ
jgi:hypothetical protein